MRPIRAYLWISYSLAVLFTIAPCLSVFISSAIASAAGAKLDEAGPHPCVIFGFDFGGLLYSMFVAGWFGLLTFPIGLIALFTIARQHLKLRKLPAVILPAAPVIRESPQELATIIRVPEPHHQTIGNPSYALKANLIALIPVIFILGGIGLCFLGGFLVPKPQMVLSRLLLIFGGSAFAWGIYTGGYCMGVYENRWVERRLRSEIRSRPDSLVEADDPDTVLTSLIPRHNWSRVKWTMASDLFLMHVDSRRREVLLEGDCYRYRIPAGAIPACQPQCFFHPTDTEHKNELWMVQLMIRAPDGMRELLLSVAQKGWGPRTNVTRLKNAREACEKILALQDPSVKV
jgi:hypothetical protein